MYKLEHIYPKGKHHEFKIRGVMRISVVYLKTSVNYNIILRIRTSVIPSHQIVNFSVSPDSNLIILLTPKPNKIPHITYTIKIHFIL